MKSTKSTTYPEVKAFHKTLDALKEQGVEHDKAVLKAFSDVWAKPLTQLGTDGMKQALIDAAGWTEYGYFVRRGFVCRHNGEFSVEIYTEFPDRYRTITVYKPEMRYGKKELTPAKVSCPSYGADAPEEVLRWAQALGLAADLARDFNIEKGVR